MKQNLQKLKYFMIEKKKKIEKKMRKKGDISFIIKFEGRNLNEI